MTDLSTFAGQAEHYAGARSRLGMPYVEPRRVRLPQVVAEPQPEEETPPAPEFEPMRDYLFVAGNLSDAEEAEPIPTIPIAPYRVILREVSQKHGIPVKQIVGEQRSRAIVAARHEAMYRMAHETRMSLPQIGQRLGGRDHTTCLHGIRMHAERNGLLAFNGGLKPNHLVSVQREGVVA